LLSTIICYCRTMSVWDWELFFFISLKVTTKTCLQHVNREEHNWYPIKMALININKWSQINSYIRILPHFTGNRSVLSAHLVWWPCELCHLWGQYFESIFWWLLNHMKASKWLDCSLNGHVKMFDDIFRQIPEFWAINYTN
jgi:hypothetical protein